MAIHRMPKRKYGSGPDRQKIAWLLLIPVILLLILMISSTWYTVEPEQVGVVTRFGAFNRETEPGLHFKWPMGIEKIQTVPIKRVLKQEFGYKTAPLPAEGGRSSYIQSEDHDEESIMLTGDLNVADVEWIVQYKIKSARDYLFRVAQPDVVLRDMSEAVMREVVGDRSVDEVLTEGRRDINREVQEKLQILMDNCNSGVQVTAVKLQDVNPPERVRPSFNDVNKAKQEKEKMINQARRQYNQEVEEAKGTAEKLLRDAEGYALDRVNRAEGDAERFTAVFEEYQKAPDIFRRRRYLETLIEILPKIRKKYVIDSKTGSSPLPILQLDPGGQR